MRIGQCGLVIPPSLRDGIVMSNLADLTIPLARLWPDEAAWDGPLAIVDLDREGEEGAFVLPPCPLIGIGDRSHPLASSLDTVIEPPVSLEGLARRVLAYPHAAAVTVQLLRVLPSLSVEQGLWAESMAYAVLQGSAEHRAWLAREDRMVRIGEGRLAVARDEARLVVALDDPNSGNAIDRLMRDALAEAFALAALDPEIETVALSAKGRTFSLGAELAEFGTTTDPATAHRIRSLTLPARAVARCADKLEVHVQGGCVGAGLELAAWGKRVTASADAWFHLPELAMGILPGAGGCVSLTRRIGRWRTVLMILSGKRLNAKQALAWGLIDAIVNESSGDESRANVG